MDKDLNKSILDQLNVKLPEDGTLQAIKYTPDGEVFMVTEGGRVVEKTRPEETLKPLPAKWKSKHKEAMFSIEQGIRLVKDLGLRQIPLTRNECIDLGVPKGTLKDLEKFGMIQQQIISIVDTQDNNKPTGGKVVVFFTPQGKAYIKKHWR